MSQSTSCCTSSYRTTVTFTKGGGIYILWYYARNPQHCVHYFLTSHPISQSPWDPSTQMSTEFFIAVVTETSQSTTRSGQYRLYWLSPYKPQQKYAWYLFIYFVVVCFCFREAGSLFTGHRLVFPKLCSHKPLSRRLWLIAGNKRSIISLDTVQQPVLACVPTSNQCIFLLLAKHQNTYHFTFFAKSTLRPDGFYELIRTYFRFG